MTETVLVTGGTGFIGGWAIVELLKRGYAVRTTVRSLNKEQQVRAKIATEVEPGERLDFFKADLTSDAGWDEAVAGCDYVLHVAAPVGVDAPRDPDELIVPTRDGALRVLGAACRAKVRRVVLTSAIEACRPSMDSPDGVSDELNGPIRTMSGLDLTVWRGHSRNGPPGILWPATLGQRLSPRSCQAP